MYDICRYLINFDDLECNIFKLKNGLPLEDVGDAKDDNTWDDVEEIKERQDTHELVEIVPLTNEPEDETDIANNTENTNDDLNMIMSTQYLLLLILYTIDRSMLPVEF